MRKGKGSHSCLGGPTSPPPGPEPHLSPVRHLGDQGVSTRAFERRYIATSTEPVKGSFTSKNTVGLRTSESENQLPQALQAPKFPGALPSKWEGSLTGLAIYLFGQEAHLTHRISPKEILQPSEVTHTTEAAPNICKTFHSLKSPTQCSPSPVLA